MVIEWFAITKGDGLWWPIGRNLGLLFCAHDDSLS
jgi:hypothetical protein